MVQANTTIDYFHINRRVHWSSFELVAPGSFLDVGGITNPYFRFFEEHRRTYPVTLPNNEQIEVPAIRFLRAVAEGAVTPHNFPLTALQLGEHLITFLREVIWEEVRQ